MDHGGAVLPGRVAARYEALTGGPEGRRTYYLVRKHLGFTATEWDALPWWQQRMYVEELAADLFGPTEGLDSDAQLAALGFRIESASHN